MNHFYPPLQEGEYSNTSSQSFHSDFDEKEKVDFVTTSEIYDAVFQNSFHAMYIGTADEAILRFNEKLCKVFGYTKKEMANITSHDLLEVNEEVYTHFLDTRTQKGIAKAEITAIRKSGERFLCRISSVIYQSDEGETRTMNTLIDISNNLSARWNILG